MSAPELNQPTAAMTAELSSPARRAGQFTEILLDRDVGDINWRVASLLLIALSLFLALAGALDALRVPGPIAIGTSCLVPLLAFVAWRRWIVGRKRREQRAMKAYRGDCGVAFSPYPNGTVLDFALEGEPGDWDDDDDDGTGWISSLAPLRAELLDGDRRSLYLAWLLNVRFDALDADVCEPPVPPKRPRASGRAWRKSRRGLGMST